MAESRVIRNRFLPNPSFIDTTRVVQLSIDTGPPPDPVLLPREHHRHHHRRR